MPYLTLEEINSNPIYQPPKHWLFTDMNGLPTKEHLKYLEDRRKKTIKSLKVFNSTYEDTDGNEINPISDLYLDTKNYMNLPKKQQVSVRYDRGEIIVRTKFKIESDRWIDENIKLIDNYIDKKNYRALVFKTYQYKDDDGKLIKSYTYHFRNNKE